MPPWANKQRRTRVAHLSCENTRNLEHLELGVENLAQIVEIYKADPDLMARYPKAN
jgi:hypothetical protein